jgi:hypothetical protein
MSVTELAPDLLRAIALMVFLRFFRSEMGGDD